MTTEWDDDVTLIPKLPYVVSETLHGEAIIMHHGTGHYLNALGSGALLWEAIERGSTIPLLTARLCSAYGIDREVSRMAVLRFLGILADYDLLGTTAAPPVDRAAAPVSAAFDEPAIHLHTDLADLLTLDPIHDVDAEGWPMPPGTAAESAPWPS